MANTHKSGKIFHAVKSTSLVVMATLVVAGSTLLAGSPQVAYADQFDQQIKELNSNIEANRGKISTLKAQGDTLANKVEEIRLETASLQAKIDVNEARNNQLKAQITEAEEKLVKNKRVLAQTIRQLYIDGDISSLEILASSTSLSEYVDKQEYRDRVKDQISTITDQVKELKIQLEGQQVEIANLLSDQVSMRTDLGNKQAELNTVLEETRGQEEAYQSQVKSDNAEVARLREEQRLANQSNIRGKISYVPSSGIANGGYPPYWDNAPKDALVDSWGMYNRECVSYTAFKVWQSGRHMPYWGGRGNANRWPGNARNAGIPVDGNPRVGDVAISMAGYYGHSMYVEAVYGDGTILISQYNYGWSGEYSEMRISPSGLYFLHF